jgi:hypothetical protein
LLKGEDHDVSGDGTVAIKFTPGHTPRHQSLFLKLARTGPGAIVGRFVSLPGRDYLQALLSFDFDRDQTAKSRSMIEEFVKRNL